jgi:putative two-component system response regulator
MPTLDGLNLCQRVKDDPTTRLVPIVLLTAERSRDSYLAALRFGADALLSIPVDSDELLTRIYSLVRTKRYTDDLEPAAGVMITLATLIETDKGYSHGHCHRMANFATAVGGRLGLDAHDLQVLRRGSFLHDIGMLAVPSAILTKSGALDEREVAIVRSHTVIGDSLIANLRSLQAVRPVVRHHHERLDGSGYPDGLSGDHIPLAAQIVGMVDAFEAMTTRRPYQHLHSVPDALDAIRGDVRRGWRRHDLVEEFVKIAQERSQ